jgi:hypothetical protein
VFTLTTSWWVAVINSNRPGIVGGMAAAAPPPSKADHSGDDQTTDHSHDDGHSGGDLRLLDIWGGVAPPRQAACWSWLAFLVTWIVTRVITHHGRGTGSSGAILIAGHHIHHYLLGIILLGLTSAVAIFVRPDRWWQALGVSYGIALALIMDEYALLLNLSDVYWSPPGHLSVDVVLTVIAVGGVYVTGVTVFNEAGRRARRRVQQRVRRTRRR